MPTTRTRTVKSIREAAVKLSASNKSTSAPTSSSTTKITTAKRTFFQKSSEKQVKAASPEPHDIEDIGYSSKLVGAYLSTGKHDDAFHHFVDENEIQDFHTSLLYWYDENKRDLPWRKPRPASPSRSLTDEDDRPAKRIKKNNNDTQQPYPASAQRAYEVWVSEIMCQQTQVATVLAYYTKWMALFPTIFDLAKAPMELVNQTWAGLGYYSRGRRLKEGAQKVVEEMGGILPKTAKELEAVVPGVGRYTAGAIASIAYGEAVELVDGNVVRVLSRLRALGLNPKGKQAIGLHWIIAKQLIHHERPGDFNQALMEFGATICAPSNPLCGSCPVQTSCHAYALQRARPRHKQKITDECTICLTPLPEDVKTTNYPSKSAKKPPRPESSATCILERIYTPPPTTDSSGCSTEPVSEILLIQRPLTGLLAGLWEFPVVPLLIKTPEASVEDEDADPDPDAIEGKNDKKEDTSNLQPSLTTSLDNNIDETPYQTRIAKTDVYLSKFLKFDMTKLPTTSTATQTGPTRSKGSSSDIIHNNNNNSNNNNNDDDNDDNDSGPGGGSSSNGCGDGILHRSDLGSVQHKFSHIEQTYYAEHVILYTGTTLSENDRSGTISISLASSNTAASSAASVAKGLTGNGNGAAAGSKKEKKEKDSSSSIDVVYKWVNRQELQNEAIPTGIMKIWELLVENEKSSGSKKGSGKSGGGGGATASAKSKDKEKEKVVVNGKNSIASYFGKKGGK